MADSGVNQTFTLDPAPGAATGPTTAHYKGLAALNSPNIDQHVNVTAGFRTITKNDNRQSAFLRFGVNSTTIPAGSLITRAYLRCFSQGTSTQTAANISIAALASDGLWDSSPTDHFFNRAEGNLFGVDLIGRMNHQVFDAGASSINAKYGTDTTIQVYPINSDAIANPTSGLGQAFLVSNDLGAGPHTLGSITLRLKRTGSNGSATQTVEVYQCRANDGSDDRPDEGVGIIATSNTRTFNTPGTGSSGSLVNFTFTAGPALTVGNRYVFNYQNNAGVSSSNYISVLWTADSTLSNPGMYPHNFATAYAFASRNYPLIGQLPHLYEADDSTVRTTPLGSIANATFPSFSSNNTWYEVEPADLKTIIQEYIDQGGYGSGSLLGITIAPSSSATLPTSRIWDSSELILSWGQPVAAAGSGSIVWSGSGLAANAKVLASAAVSIVWSIASAAAANTSKAAAAAVSIVWSAAASAIQGSVLASAAVSIVWSISSAVATNTAKAAAAAVSIIWSAIGTAIATSAAIVGILRFRSRATPAVSGEGDARAAVSGQGDAVSAVHATSSARAAVSGKSDAQPAVRGEGKVR